MILVFTNSDDATADYLCRILANQSHRVVRLDTDADLRNVRITYDQDGAKLCINNACYKPQEFDALWYRRPLPLKPRVDCSEIEQWHIAYEWSEAIEGFLAHIPIEKWINHPSRNAMASHKLEQLTRAFKFGLSIPQSLVTQSSDRLRKFWDSCNGQVIVKPLGCGYLERDSPSEDTSIYTNIVSLEDLEHTQQLITTPTLFQQLIHKTSDVRIVVIDELATAVEIVGIDSNTSKQRVDIRRNNMEDVDYTVIDIPKNIEKSLLMLMRSYGLRFSAIDMAIDESGEWIFFEINPNGQWAWLDISGPSKIACDFVKSFSIGKSNV